jgi:hypothetical protein
MYLKNTTGKPDAVLTMAVVAFAVIMFRVLFAGMKFNFSGNMLEFSSIDAGLVGTILTSTLGAYVARRYTDKGNKKLCDGCKGKLCESCAKK